MREKEMLQRILMMLTFTLPSFAFSASLEVYPPSLKKLPSQELGQVVLKFMPSTSSKVNWYTNANDNSFVWIDPTFVETTLNDGTIYSSRRGVFRGHVNGVKSTFLYNRVNEMPWIATMEGQNPRHGVQAIRLNPAVVLLNNRNEEGDCFGSTHENCEFSPFLSLKRSGITYKKICENKIGAGNFRIAYLLTKAGKKNTYGVWEESSGSGGKANIFTLDYSENKTDICEKINKLY